MASTKRRRPGIQDEAVEHRHSAPLPVTPVSSDPVSRWPLAARLPRPLIRTDSLALLFSLYFAVVSSLPFWHVALAGRNWHQAATWAFAVAALVALVCLNTIVLGLLLTRWTARPLLALLTVVAAVASFYAANFGVVLDPGMMRNALHTEVKEAADLIGWPLLRHLVLEAGPMLVLLAWVRIQRGTMVRQLLRRSALVLGSVLLLAGSLGLSYQDLSALFRNQKEARYLIAPLNVVYSTVRVLALPGQAAPLERQLVGTDVRLGASWAQPRRPVLLFVVVGETARAANWGLNGYPRQTTPELATMDVVNYTDVSSCGSDTETSLPCLFSPVGRRHYDAQRIRASQSLLPVLARAGFEVQWRDNQTGCKGVCDGLPYRQVDVDQPDCQPGQCPDQKLLDGLEAELRRDPVATGVPGRVVVMHQIGNHGPAYYKRYPASFRHFTPACETADLGDCSAEQIVNAYDNALRYTDHVLAESIHMLERLSDRYDTAMLYVSDHGESLGERGLYLHGIPYAVAPAVQTHVPMVVWLSRPFQAASALDQACLARRRELPVSHDNVFSSLLGLLDLDTTVREGALDLTAGCRPTRLGPQDARGTAEPVSARVESYAPEASDAR